MRDQLTEYLQLVEHYLDLQATVRRLRSRSLTATDTGRLAATASAPTNDLKSTAGELRRREATVKQILARLATGLADFDFDKVGGASDARNAVQRGLGVIDDVDTWAINLAPDAPMLAADQFHPWVWSAAQPLWSAQHYRQAVQAAATALNARLQQKVSRRDVSDVKLVQEAFSTDAPGPGKPRLRLPGDPDDESRKNRERGALHLGVGAGWVIRNPATHDEEDWDEQTALERLATLSVFARLVDECVVVTAESL